MVTKINNSELTKEIIAGAKIQSSHDSVPSELGDKVIPVMEVNPRLLRTIDIIRNARYTASGGSNVLYAVDTGKEFYITSALISLSKSATCDSATGAFSLNIFTDGVVRSLIALETTALTFSERELSVSFPFPVRVDPGTNITMTQGTFTAGTFSRGAGITGFYVRNANA